mmetsp:Transcript_67659/g.188798  ORF Transcript_67659/g.188798 Transcript_67659/m.188798 type:complete len:91 (+) Transcript_67659:1250-1522(+)
MHQSDGIPDAFCNQTHISLRVLQAAFCFVDSFNTEAVRDGADMRRCLPKEVLTCAKWASAAKLVLRSTHVRPAAHRSATKGLNALQVHCP